MLTDEGSKKALLTTRLICNITPKSFIARTMPTVHWLEYVAFSLMMGLSILIGVYYGCYKRNQNTVSEYMQGGKNMGVIPIAISFIVSHISGITLLGVPEEVYKYGTQHLAVIWCCLIVTVLILSFYLPVFHKLQLNSPYEYLERRFNHNVRWVTSLLFTISLILFLPAVIYVPALAFNQVTGINVHTIALTVCIICIFYTSLGGLRAVVWTDTIQSIFSFGSVLFVLIVGTISLGGPMNVYKINDEGHRIELFNMDPSPFERCTFWTTTIGMTCNWIAHLILHPGSIQRFTAVSTYKKAVKVTWLLCIGLVIIQTACGWVGLIMYAKYRDCDPVASKVIHKSGQLLPLYIMDTAGQYPGLSGLFISGVVSLALSTLSACLNTVSGTIYEDFVKIFCANKYNDATASFIMKMTVVIIGIICVALVFIVEKLGTIFQMAISLSGVTNGTIGFVFTFGILFPWGTTKGALAGIIVSLVSTAWIVGGAQFAIAAGRMKFPGKITSVDGCANNLTEQLAHNLTFTYEGVGSPVVTDGTVPLLYQLSYTYYSTFGIIIGMAVAIVVSLITGTQDLTELDPDLIAPQMRRFLPKKIKHKIRVPTENEYKLVNLKQEDQDE